jgi:geranylgeranyl reductase family protein
MYDVIIIGCGVAGTTAGYFLAQSGIKALMIEKERIPRYKTCGGGVISRVTKILPFSLDNAIERQINKADIFDQTNGLHFQVKREIPIINMTMREKLDQLILKKAIENGAELQQGTIVKDITKNKDYVEVFANGTTLTSKFIIGADGAMGITARKVGASCSYKKVPAIESEVYVDDDTFNKFCSAARFDFGIIPHGYGWVFPKRNHLSIGVSTMKDSGRNLNNLMKSYLNYLNLSNLVKEDRHGFIIPFGNKRGRFAFGRLLLVGDAAGLADPVTAEGISYAIESGKYAADSILNGVNDVERINKTYETSVKKILKELKYAKTLAYFIYGPPSLRSFVFKRYGRDLSNLMTDVITGEVKYSELLSTPMNYLKLLRPNFLRRI